MHKDLDDVFIIFGQDYYLLSQKELEILDSHELRVTFFYCCVDVSIIIGQTSYGGGWNLTIENIFLDIPKDTVFMVSTKQTIARIKEDVVVRFSYNDKEYEQTFDTLGWLVACGAIRQIIFK